MCWASSETSLTEVFVKLVNKYQIVFIHSLFLQKVWNVCWVSKDASAVLKQSLTYKVWCSWLWLLPAIKS